MLLARHPHCGVVQAIAFFHDMVAGFVAYQASNANRTRFNRYRVWELRDTPHFHAIHNDSVGNAPVDGREITRAPKTFLGQRVPLGICWWHWRQRPPACELHIWTQDIATRKRQHHEQRQSHTNTILTSPPRV